MAYHMLWVWAIWDSNQLTTFFGRLWLVPSAMNGCRVTAAVDLTDLPCAAADPTEAPTSAAASRISERTRAVRTCAAPLRQEGDS